MFGILISLLFNVIRRLVSTEKSTEKLTCSCIKAFLRSHSRNVKHCAPENAILLSREKRVLGLFSFLYLQRVFFGYCIVREYIINFKKAHYTHAHVSSREEFIFSLGEYYKTFYRILVLGSRFINSRKLGPFYESFFTEINEYDMNTIFGLYYSSLFQTSSNYCTHTKLRFRRFLCCAQHCLNIPNWQTTLQLVYVTQTNTISV